MTTQTSRRVLAEQQLVVFDLGAESYGVDIGTVREIIRMQEVTSLPNTAHYVEGIINLRGKVIPVVDLRRRFDLDATEHTKDTRIVVVDIGDNDIGVIVDSVTEVLRVSGESIESDEAVASIQRSEFLIGIAKLEEKLIILLDLASMLSQEDDALEAAQKGPSAQAKPSRKKAKKAESAPAAESEPAVAEPEGEAEEPQESEPAAAEADGETDESQESEPAAAEADGETDESQESAA